jgi:predicted DNA-binding protein (MmcQ/YjbR family)
MNVEELRSFCLSIPGTEECLPFDDVSLVYKVMGKMYALIPLDAPECCISVKCDPEEALELRDRYAAVEEAYHFNKKYWNTLYPNRDMDDKDVMEWIRHSVEEVIKKLSRIRREEYQAFCRTVKPSS